MLPNERFGRKSTAAATGLIHLKRVLQWTVAGDPQAPENCAPHEDSRYALRSD